MSTVKVCDVIVSILEAAGIDTCFGVPGGQTVPFYGAARARGFNHILMRDERNAACAADAYARVSGRVGMCDATVGPGSTNLISGLAEAYASAIPVLALVADIRTNREHLRHRGVSSQALEQGSILAPVTKWVGRVQTPGSLVAVFDHALRVATSGRPGPVVVEIPEDFMAAPIPEPDLSKFSPASAVWPRHRTAPLPQAVADAVARLARAKRPIVLAGGGAMASGAGAEIARFADEFGIPIVTSINGKGVVSERNPLALGVVGVFGDIEASRTLKQADTVLVLGSKFAQFNSFLWRLPNAGQEIIHVDIDGEELGRAIPAALEIVGDAREAARAIGDGLAARKARFSWKPEGEPLPQPGTKPDDPAVAPERVMEAINVLMDDGAILVSDASLASGWTASRFQTRRAGRSYLAPRGLAGIGWAGGAAIGAALAAPRGTPVIAVAGDGAAGYWLGEIETAARLKLPITFVILNNAGYGWVIQGERSLGITPESVFAPVDFAAIGKAMGTGAARAASINEVQAGLTEAFAGKGPYVLDVLSSERSSPSIDWGVLEPKSANALGAYGMG
ncbi:thiamine pyrophosphate-binding protein [Phenylobacterium sp.]|uniref:thiamine pyrophosphate-binding protein n=1 Tax=Phenylobacterium sp. TaxID=1871053 RepID=UPI0035648907